MKTNTKSGVTPPPRPKAKMKVEKEVYRRASISTRVSLDAELKELDHLASEGLDTR